MPTAPYVCGFKPQIAYFAAAGAEGQLEDLCAYMRENYPHLPIMMDAKRGDIGCDRDSICKRSVWSVWCGCCNSQPISWRRLCAALSGVGRPRASSHCAAPQILVAQICNSLKQMAFRYICGSLTWLLTNGIPRVNAVLLSARHFLTS